MNPVSSRKESTLFRIPDLRSALEFDFVYRTFQSMIGSSARARLVETYVRPQQGDRILDIGCGPADVLNHLDQVEYVGVDVHPNYIRAASRRYGSKGEFHCLPVGESLTQFGKFDLVLAIGLLHHLDDSEATTLLEVASRAIKPEGRLITLDGCFLQQQNWIARTLLNCDRGRFVRQYSEYLALAKTSFLEVRCSTRHDLMRLPYSHLIMECQQQAGRVQSPVPSSRAA